MQNLKFDKTEVDNTMYKLLYLKQWPINKVNTKVALFVRYRYYRIMRQVNFDPGELLTHIWAKAYQACAEVS